MFPVFLALFVVLAPVFYFAYDKTNDEVYYDMGQCLPEDMEYVIANSKLSEEFDIASTHMLLVDASLPSKQVRSMISDMEQVDGVKYVLGLESVVGADVPEEILPDSVRSILKSDKWELLLINSEYKVASDEVNAQIDSLNAILKKYDPTGMLIGEAPCMKDMIETTDHDFKVVNAVSILAIFLIILLVERSISLPFLLIAVIELAIFINLGLPHFLGQSLPFIAPICISTIQLGATVDYAILMTTRYKAERLAGKEKRPAVITALSTSIPSPCGPRPPPSSSAAWACSPQRSAWPSIPTSTSSARCACLWRAAPSSVCSASSSSCRHCCFCATGSCAPRRLACAIAIIPENTRRSRMLLPAENRRQEERRS